MMGTYGGPCVGKLKGYTMASTISSHNYMEPSHRTARWCSSSGTLEFLAYDPLHSLRKKKKLFPALLIKTFLSSALRTHDWSRHIYTKTLNMKTDN